VRKFDKQKVIEFFNDRVGQVFKNINPSVVKAVIKSANNDILKISQKIEALNLIVVSSDFKELNNTFKRVANIIKDINEHTFEAILKAEKLGGYKALSASKIFEVEYWSLEQAKLKK